MAIIKGNVYGETIVGTTGNDTIDGAGGDDFIDGAAGTDTAVFFGKSSDFTITNLSGAVRVTGLGTAPYVYRDSTVKLLNTEKAQFTDSTVTLAAQTNNIILTNRYGETIVGTTGNDTIDGAGGSDFIDGAAGTDTAVFFGKSSDFTITNLSGAVRVTGLGTAPSAYNGYTGNC